MANATGAQLAEGIRQKIGELKKVCEGLDEGIASRAPAGRWSPKEILSHLLGPEGTGVLPTFQAFIDREIPKIDVEAENPFFSKNRARMTFAPISPCSKTPLWENIPHWRSGSTAWDRFMSNFISTI